MHVGTHQRTPRARRAWASQLHATPSRVHRESSVPPLSRRTHPLIRLPRCRRRLHGERRPSSVHFLPMCVHVPLLLFLKELGLCYHPTAHAHKLFISKIIYKPIYFETADYGIFHRTRFCVFKKVFR